MVFVLTQEENDSFQRFYFKANRKSLGSPKMTLRIFKIAPRLGDWYITITGDFERFQYFDFGTSLLKNENLLKTNFHKKVLRLKMQHFHKKLICQRPILRQIEWGVQNGPITKNGVLLLTTFFFET